MIHSRLLLLAAALAVLGLGTITLARQAELPKESSLQLIPELKLDLVLIPKGTFTMGGLVGAYPTTMPAHEVTITKPFYFGKYHVTQEQYVAIMGKNPSRDKGDKHPVKSMTRDNAKEFCAKVSKLTGRTVRLPSEAEWEYACRAGTKTAYSCGDSVEELKKYAWFSHSGVASDEEKTHPVGSLKPNPWGLYDMHGNAYQLCEDWFDDAYYAKSPKEDPVNTVKANAPNRNEAWTVIRGGCAGSPPALQRSANRRSYSPLGKHTIGFRVVVEASADAKPEAPKETWVNPPTEKFPGVEHKTFASAALKTDVGYNIYLPPDYAASDKRYPVVYYLPGRGDTESTHLANVKVLHEAIEKKQLPPLIYVHTFTGKTSWFTDAPKAGIMAETLIIKELIPHIDKTYRTIASRDGRAIQGFSMGGNGALKFAFKYPDQFSSVTAYAASLFDSTMMQKRLPVQFKALFDDDPKAFDEQTPPVLLKKNLDKINGKLAIRIVVGDKDTLLEPDRKLHALLEELKVPHQFEEVPGIGHDPQAIYRQVGVKGWEFNVKAFK